MSALLALLAGLAAAQDTSLPTGTGLPLLVRTGVYFLEVEQVDDTAATFQATVDVRLTWDDLRLRYPAEEAPSGFRQYRAEEADAELAKIWHPAVELANLVDGATFETRGLRVSPSGRVELIQRTRGRFATPFDVERFPFDRQRLAVELVSFREPSQEVLFDFRQSEVDFSRASRSVALGGWEVGAVELQRRPQEGWYGDQQSRMYASLLVARDPLGTVAPIFVPLFASLLIPLLALWLNQSEDDGGFKVEAFELANVLIGGLFALIALNFTLNATYPMLAADNPVSMLFGLNYLLLAANLAINIFLMRFGLVKRWFGPHVQREVYAFTVWAMPAVAVICAGAILLRAMA